MGGREIKRGMVGRERKGKGREGLYIWHGVYEAAKRGMCGGAFADGAGGEVDHRAVLEEGKVDLEIHVKMSWYGKRELDWLVGRLHVD